MKEYYKRIMPHIHKGRFYNYEHEPHKSIVLPTLGMYLSRLLNPRYSLSKFHNWNAHEQHIIHPIPVSHETAPTITWIGHASFLIEFPHLTIITDPVFGNITPFFRRFSPPGIARDTLCDIDVVIISHNHRDHLERSTIRYLASKFDCVFFVPSGDGALLKQWGVRRVVECMWWDQHTTNHPYIATPTPGTITFLPAYHWSQRTLFDKNKSLWGSWMIEVGNYRCYFAGDTAYGPHFQVIAQEFPQIDVALLPIGPCEPHRWLKNSHLNAEQACEAFCELKAAVAIPMHWGTFGFGIDDPLTPLSRVQQCWTERYAQRHATQMLCPLRIGQALACVPTTTHTSVRHATSIEQLQL